MPGAGKSTLARALCRARPLTRVDRDAIRRELFPDGRIDDFAKGAATRESFVRAAHELGRCRSVVMDGMTLASAAQRRQARELARRHGARCIEIFVQCPRALARERVARDAHHLAADRTPALVDDVARRFAPVRRGVRLNAREPTRRQLRRVLAALR